MTIFSETIEKYLVSDKATYTPSTPPYVIVTEGTRVSKQRLGKVLTKLHPALNNETIKALVAEYKVINSELADYTVSYTRDYVTTYETDLYAIDSTSKSCMTGMDAVQVYDYDDRLACLLIHRENELVGRTLVRWDCNEYVRLYLDHNKIKSYEATALVTKAGFTLGDLEGIKLTRIDDGYRIVCPYIDGKASRVDIHSNYLEIVRYGDEEATSTEGYIRTATCACCNDSIYRDECGYVEGLGDVCEHCLIHEFVYIEELDEYVHKDDCVINESTGEYVTQSWADRNLVYLDYRRSGYYNFEDVVQCPDEEYYHIDDVVRLEVPYKTRYEEYYYIYPKHSDCIYYEGDDNIDEGYYFDEQLDELKAEFATEE